MCLVELAFTEFYTNGSKIRSACKACVSAQRRQPQYKKWRNGYEARPEVKASKAVYRASPRCKAMQPAYHARRLKKRPDYGKTRYEYKRLWSKTPPGRAYVRARNRKLSTRLRVRLAMAIRNEQKTGSAVRDLGCTVEQLQLYLEASFKPGMTWSNWGRGPGTWQIDHIKPLCSFDLTQRRQLREACWFGNLQPLWHEEHSVKSAGESRALAA